MSFEKKIIFAFPTKLIKLTNMVDYIFYLCVDILIWLAKITGTSYEFINILIFIIGYPLFVIFLITIIHWQYKKIKKLNKKFNI